MSNKSCPLCSGLFSAELKLNGELKKFLCEKHICKKCDATTDGIFIGRSRTNGKAVLCPKCDQKEALDVIERLCFNPPIDFGEIGASRSITTIKISIGLKDFDKLVRGQILKFTADDNKHEVEIALQDVGHDLMIHLIEEAKWKSYVNQQWSK